MTGKHILSQVVVLLAVMSSALDARSAETIILSQKVHEYLSADDEIPKRTSMQTLYISPGRIRLDNSDGTYQLIDFDKGLLYDVDTLLKSYSERDIRNFEARWQKINSLLLKQIEGVPENHPRRAELVDQLTDGPSKWDMIWKLRDSPAKDALLKKYYLPPKPPVVEVVKTGEKKTIAGYECILYKVMEDGKLRSYAWVAPKVPLEKDLAEFLKVTGIIEETIAKELMKVKGFPIEYGMYWRNGRVEKTVTDSAEKKDKDKSFFEIPEQYVKQAEKKGF